MHFKSIDVVLFIVLGSGTQYTMSVISTAHGANKNMVLWYSFWLSIFCNNLILIYKFN